MSHKIAQPRKRQINMAFRVVAKSGWRKVPLPPEFFEKEGAEGLTCIEELTDYDLTEDGHLQVNKSKVVAYEVMYMKTL